MKHLGSDSCVVTGPLTSSRPSRRRLRARAVLFAAPLLGLGFVDPPQDKTAPLPRHGTYIGRSQCIECHEDEDNLILQRSQSETDLGVDADVAARKHTWITKRLILSSSAVVLLAWAIEVIALH